MELPRLQIDGTPYSSQRGPYPSEERPTCRLSAREFAYLQRRNSDRLLLDLIDRGWASYCFANSLVTPSSPLPDRQIPNLGSLLLSWDKICIWYREQRFERQLDLFLASDEMEIRRWSSFAEHQCFVPILRSAHLTRSLLRETGMLPGTVALPPVAASNIALFLAEIATSFD